MLHEGTVLDGRYRVHSQIGRGGLAVTYRADDLRDGKPVVLKILRSDASTSLATGVERLSHEAQILAKVRHPNILPYVEFRQGNPWTYLVVEWVPGDSLQQRIQQRRSPFSIREITPWLGALCDTLGYLGQQDIVHRDLKPANVLIAPDNRLVLIDFNVAMDLTRAAQDPYAREPVGTAIYAAPEQMAKRAVDARADVYALGTILYELLTLTRPFADVERKTSKEERWDKLKEAKTTRDPPSLARLRPDLPSEFVAIVDQALARQPETRWPSAQTLWARWLQAMGGPELQAQSAPANSALPSTGKPASPHRSKAGLAVAAMLVLGLLGLVGFVLIDPIGHRPTALPPLPVCQETRLQQGLTWDTCVTSAALGAEHLRVTLEWQLRSGNPNTVVVKASDEGNPNMYLLDAQGHRYAPARYGDGAAKEIDMTPGRVASGWYEFPLPEDPNPTLTFVDADNGVRLTFALP